MAGKREVRIELEGNLLRVEAELLEAKRREQFLLKTIELMLLPNLTERDMYAKFHHDEYSSREAALDKETTPDESLNVDADCRNCCLKSKCSIVRMARLFSQKRLSLSSDNVSLEATDLGLGLHSDNFGEGSKPQVIIPLFNQDFIIALIVDPQTKCIIEASDGACTFYGYSHEQIRGLHISQINIHDGKEIACAFRRILVGEQHKFRFQHRTSSGEIKDVLLNTGLITYNNSPAVYSVIFDITERVKAEQALYNAEEKYRSLTQNSYDITTVIDAEGIITYESQATFRILGYPAGKRIGRNALDFVHPDDVDRVVRELTQLINSPSDPSVIEFRFLHEDGQWVWLEVSGQNLIEDLNIRGLVINSRDITERKASESALKESEEIFRSITTAANDAIIMLNSAGLVTFWNRAAETIFGYRAAEMMGDNLCRILPPSIDATQLINTITQFQTTGGFYGKGNTVETFCVRKNGQQFPVELSASSIVLRGENFSIGIVRDITERKLAEKALLERKEQLKAINATKDKLFSIIGHDLKNPFNSISGFSELLLANYKKYDSQRIEQFLEVIRSSSDSAYQLLNTLLEWSRSQMGDIPFNPSKLDLYELVNRSCELLQGMATKKGVELSFQKCHGCMVYADANMVDTIIRNLITNAIKYTPAQGQVSVSFAKSEDMYQVAVHDTGIGIAPSDIKKLFRIDSKFQREGTDSEAGTGLGLVLCKEFVEKNGGRIWVESQEGAGSTFCFTLPMDCA